MINSNNKHKVVSHSKKSTKEVSLEDSVKMLVCYQLAGLHGKELLKTFSRYTMPLHTNIAKSQYLL